MNKKFLIILLSLSNIFSANVQAGNLNPFAYYDEKENIADLLKNNKYLDAFEFSKNMYEKYRLYAVQNITSYVLEFMSKNTHEKYKIEDINYLFKPILDIFTTWFDHFISAEFKETNACEFMDLIHQLLENVRLSVLLTINFLLKDVQLMYVKAYKRLFMDLLHYNYILHHKSQARYYKPKTLLYFEQISLKIENSLADIDVLIGNI